VNEETENIESESPESGGMSNMQSLAGKYGGATDKPIEGQVVEGEETAQASTGKSLADYIPVEKLLAMAINITCNNIKPLKKYNVSEADAQTLGNAWGPVLESFMPNVPEGPITNALLVTGVIVGPKIAKAKKQAKLEKLEGEKPLAEQRPEKQTENKQQEEVPQNWQPVSSRKVRK